MLPKLLNQPFESLSKLEHEAIALLKGLWGVEINRLFESLVLLINDVKAVVTAVRNFDDDTFAKKLEEIARKEVPNFQLGKLDGTLAVIFEDNVDTMDDPFADLDHDTVGETS